MPVDHVRLYKKQFVVDRTETLRSVTNRYIQHVLDEFDGNKSLVCQILKIDRKTLYLWLKKNGRKPMAERDTLTCTAAAENAASDKAPLTKESVEEFKRLVSGVSTEDGRDYFEELAIWTREHGDEVIRILEAWFVASISMAIYATSPTYDEKTGLIQIKTFFVSEGSARLLIDLFFKQWPEVKKYVANKYFNRGSV